MQDLMDFNTVSELLELDARDEKRNRMLLGAVSEQISLHLNRNLIQSTTTEQHTTRSGEFLPQEYPLRAIETLIDANTGETIALSASTPMKDISRPDAHHQRHFRIDSDKDRTILITYQYGYDQAEMPQLIQEAVLEMISDRIIMFGKGTVEDTRNMDKDRLMNLTPYKRIFYR